MLKALEILKQGKTVNERADSYLKGIKRELQYSVIDGLTRQKEKLEEEIFELENFNLSTDLNKGLKQMTQDDCKQRFQRLIDIRYEKYLLEKELEIKQNAFNHYFVTEEVVG